MGYTDMESGEGQLEALVSDGANVYGSYIHGLFDAAAIAEHIVGYLAQKKGIKLSGDSFLDYSVYKEQQYDKLADTLRQYLDMDAIYGMLREAEIDGA